MTYLKSLLAKGKVVTAQVISNSSSSSSPSQTATSSLPKVVVPVTPRDLFVAPKGWCLVDLDYSNQELYTAAIISNDAKMLMPFSDSTPKYIKGINDNGEEEDFVNPDSDAHLITAQSCCFPQLFEGVPKYKWDSIARNKKAIPGLLDSPRNFGKTTNFGILYLQTAKAMAELNYLKPEICEQWIAGHKKTYVDFHEWVAYIKQHAEARGWTRTFDGRWRWCAEANSKGLEGGDGRMAVNAQIQGLANSQLKRALNLMRAHFKDQPVYQIANIHDELILEMPYTHCKVLQLFDKDNKYAPVIEFDQQVLTWANEAKELMQKSQEYYFDKIALDRGLPPGFYKGMANVVIGFSWQH